MLHHITHIIADEGDAPSEGLEGEGGEGGSDSGGSDSDPDTQGEQGGGLEPAALQGGGDSEDDDEEEEFSMRSPLAKLAQSPGWKPTQSVTSTVTSTPPASDTSRNATQDSMGRYLSLLGDLRASVLRTCDDNLSRAIDQKNAHCVETISSLTAYKTSLLQVMVLNTHRSQRSPVGEAFSSAFGPFDDLDTPLEVS